MHRSNGDGQHRVMPKRAPLKILIVDDHAALRRTVRQLFDAPDIQIIEASSGEEAIVAFGTEHPDWVIMDLRMPGIGGIKAAEAIRTQDANAQVIMISQFVGAEYSEQARRIGAIDLVNKEDLNRLTQIIRSGNPPAHPSHQP